MSDRLPTMHVLKCWAEPFAALLSGAKRHEIRKDDRGFREGDVLDLMEWDQEHDAFKGRMLRMRVTHISTGWGLPDGLVVMSVMKMPEPEERRAIHCIRSMISAIVVDLESALNTAPLSDGGGVCVDAENIARALRKIMEMR